MALAVAAPDGGRRDRDRGRRPASPSPSPSSSTLVAARQPVTRPTRVVLVGFMGAGKSTVGPERRAGAGLPVPRPRPGARAAPGPLRARALPHAGRGRLPGRGARRRPGAAAQLERHVIAAGGGAFAQPETRDVLRAGAFTVWLRCGLEAVCDRIPTDGSRPLAADRATIAATVRPAGVLLPPGRPGGRCRAVAGFRRTGRGPGLPSRCRAVRARTRPRRATFRAPFGAVRRTSERCGT